MEFAEFHSTFAEFHLEFDEFRLEFGKYHLEFDEFHLIFGKYHLEFGKFHLVVGNVHLIVGKKHSLGGDNPCFCQQARIVFAQSRQVFLRRSLNLTPTPLQIGEGLFVSSLQNGGRQGGRFQPKP
ncbi:MAG: hypothetical protein EAZ95_11125 [Bacteroidetes bacterium]|nr:MAG: hypothetical protein EAZ95_11125 [Bacteroidota bacterium]